MWLSRSVLPAALAVVASALILGVLGLQSGEAGAVPGTLTVDALSDGADASPGDGICDDGAGNCTLRAAIEETNDSPGLNGIAFSVTGTIVVSGGLPTITSGVTITGPGSGALTIDANSTGRVVEINSPSNDQVVTISGVTVTGGSYGGGAGIQILTGDTLNLQSSVVTGNVSSSGSGGIVNDGIAEISDSTISTNVATNGGGISNWGTMTIVRSTISGNTATTSNGGGINNGGDLVISESTVSGNSTVQSGAGILSQQSGTTTATNVTISGNRANDSGGGLLGVNQSTVVLANVTITGNVADDDNDGGGIAGGILDYTNQVTVRNTIVAGNISRGSTTNECSGSFVSAGYNLVADDSNCTGFTATGDQVGTAGSPIDPLLGPLQDNGGPTETHSLMTGSPAIDSGNPAAPGSGDACETIDQRGLVRPADGDSNGSVICDIGALELGASPPALDSDQDGCTDYQELGADPTLGGMRDPNSPWDFFDVPTGSPLARDGNVASLDIFQVLGRFNATDVGPGDFDRNSDPLSTPNAMVGGGYRANYHPAYDRGPLVGPNIWDLGPADGSIAAPDIFAVLGQFGHSCA